MDAILFDPNLVDCYLNGEGDYDFLISMFGSNLTAEELDVLTEKMGDILEHCLQNIDATEDVLRRSLQIFHAIRDINLTLTWQQWQHIAVPYLSICASVRSISMLKLIYVTLNQLLQDSTFRRVIVSDDIVKPAIAEMGKQMIVVGDYESQAVILETMFRISHGNRSEWAPIWFADEEFISLFIEFDGGEFEKTCRYFLNFLNDSIGDQRVYSFVAQSVFIDELEMKKPPECDFWIDFNYTSKSISFYCIDHEAVEDPSDESSSMWETVNLTYDLMDSCHLRVMPQPELQEIIMHLKRPYFNKKSENDLSMEEQGKAPVVKLLFDDCYELWFHMKNMFGSLCKSRDIEGSLTHVHAASSGNKLHIDGQPLTSTPADYAENMNFHDLPCSQLTPLTTMVSQHDNPNDPLNHRLSENGMDALVCDHDRSANLMFQQNSPSSGNVLSQSYNFSRIQASIKQENPDSASPISSPDSYRSTDAVVLQTRVKEEITTSAELEVTTLDDSGVKTVYNIIKEVSESVVTLTPIKDLTEVNEGDKELGVVSQELTNVSVNSEPEASTEENILPKLNKSSKMKSKKAKLQSSETSTKRKRSVTTDSSVWIDGNKEESDVIDPFDHIKASCSSNITSKAMSGNKRTESSGKTGKSVAKSNAKGSKKLPEDNVSTSSRNHLNSGINHPEETSEPVIEMSHRSLTLKKSASTRSAPLKSRGKNQTNGGMTSDPLPPAKSTKSLRGKHQTINGATASPSSIAECSIHSSEKNKSTNDLITNTSLTIMPAVASGKSSDATSSQSPIMKSATLLCGTNQVNADMTPNSSPNAKSVSVYGKDQTMVGPSSFTESAALLQGKNQTEKEKSPSPTLAIEPAIFIPEDRSDMAMKIRLLELLKSKEFTLYQKKDGVAESASPQLEQSLIVPHTKIQTENEEKSPPCLIKSIIPLVEMENEDDKASLSPPHLSDSTILSGNKKQSNEKNLGPNKASTKTGRKRRTLYNSNRQEIVEFSPVKMDDNEDLAMTLSGKIGKVNVKQAKNAAAKKKRQPRAKAKKLSSIDQESAPHGEISLVTFKADAEENLVSLTDGYASDDYGLYSTPYDVSKSKNNSAIIPKRNLFTKDSGFATADEKSTLIAITPQSPELPAKKWKTSADDNAQVDVTVKGNTSTAVADQTTPSSDSASSEEFSGGETKHGQEVQQNVKKISRKAAVSSMKKTKKIFQPPKGNFLNDESDSASIVELLQVQPSTSKMPKRETMAFKNLFESDPEIDSEVSWLKGDKKPPFEAPTKTYKIWKNKNSKNPNRRIPKPQVSKKKTRKRNMKASYNADTDDSYHWSKIDEFDLLIEEKGVKPTNISNMNFVEENTDTVSKTTSQQEGKPQQKNVRKVKKSPLLELYMARQQAISTPKAPIRKQIGNSVPLLKNNVTDVPFLENNATDVPLLENNATDVPLLENNEDDVPLIDEAVVMDTREADSYEGMTHPLPPVETVSPKQSQIPLSSRTFIKKKISEPSQNERKLAEAADKGQSPILKKPSPSLSSDVSPINFDDHPMNNFHLPSSHDSDSSRVGSFEEQESVVDLAANNAYMRHYNKPARHLHSPMFSAVPDGRKTLLKRFLTDVGSTSSTSRQKKKQKLISGKKGNSAHKMDYRRKFNHHIGQSTSRNPGLFMNDGGTSRSSSQRLRNTSYDCGSDMSSDTSMSLMDQSIPPLDYEQERKLLEKFLYTAQMLTSNLYNAMISIREDYLKILSDFDSKNQLLSGNLSSMKEYQRMKTQYWFQMRNRLKKLLDALDTYRTKEKRFEEAFKLLKKQTGARYAEARYELAAGALHNYEKKLLCDLKKVMSKTTQQHRFFGHL